MRLLIPYYIYPTSNAVNNIPANSIIIINPYNGPGLNKDANYATFVSQCQAKGIMVIGYVFTAYATRVLTEIEADINTFNAWYGVDGIFFDQASTDVAKVSYYSQLDTFVKSGKGKCLTVLNFGTNTDEAFANAGDILVTIENDYSNYGKTSVSQWTENYPSQKFCNIIYDVPLKSLDTVLYDLHMNNIGWCYVTNAQMPNPYNKLPATLYWIIVQDNLKK